MTVAYFDRPSVRSYDGSIPDSISITDSPRRGCLYQTDESRTAASRAALFALQTAAPGIESIDTLILLPQFVPIALEDLVALVASEATHLTCVGVRHKTTLSIGWWPTDPADAHTHRRMMGEMLSGFERQLGHEPTETRLVIAGSSEWISLSYAQLQRFLYDFYLPFVDYHLTVAKDRSPSDTSQATLRLTPAAFPRLEMRRIT